MRIAIREQLAALVIFSVLISLTIVSVPTWVFVRNFVVGVESDSLSLTASLKAARIASQINLVQTICQTIATRILLQQSYIDFYNGNTSDPWSKARFDLESAMSSGGLTGLLQARLYSRNTTGDSRGLLNVTGSGVGGQTNNIGLPYLAPDGSRVNLSDTDYGYPPSLYPNITYESLGYPNPYQPSTPAFAANAFSDVRLNDNNGLLLGPLVINESFALVSVTIPVRALTVSRFILGYITFIASANLLIEELRSDEGLGSTGMVLLVGPASPSNRFNKSMPPNNGSYTPPRDAFASSPVHFVLPTIPKGGQGNRHSDRDYKHGDFADRFTLSQFPGVFDVYFNNISAPNHATAILSTTNEQGVSVAVGVARPQSTLVDWAVVVEKTENEAFQPIDTLRKILLGCVFGTVGLVIILIFPCAHLSVMPIRRLKSATEKSILPPGSENEFHDEDHDEHNSRSDGSFFQKLKRGDLVNIWRRMKEKRKSPEKDGVMYDESRRRRFRIPGRVQDRRHYIRDELTELTQTFNEMTDELQNQYTSLDEKVAERTRELEISKRAAEAANESKTLFIANISHELKTPLNGIMGMCAVCMEEGDIVRIKQSLKTLYRSGDLLLHLLEDLLSFSKNQIGQHVSLEEREFRLDDITSQILSIFEKQVRENEVTFKVTFLGTDHTTWDTNAAQNSLGNVLPALGPPGVGRLKDMYLWGDQHRILQVIINLVSNSLKFTPAGGKVELRIRCVREIEQISEESRASISSKKGSVAGGRGRNRHRVGSRSSHSASSRATNAPSTPINGYTALSINPMDPKNNLDGHAREKSPMPPPPGAIPYLFEFEVEDTGLGIADHMQDKIFEPFVQGDLRLSKKYGGTGLGLSICSQLANLMGGSIDLKSKVGVGSTFTMQIPLRHVIDRAPSSAASTSTKSRRPSFEPMDGDNARNSLSTPVPEQKVGSTSAVQDKQPRLVGLSAPFFVANPKSNPGKKHQSADGDKARSVNADTGKLRILVADDNSTNVEVVSRMLKLEDVHDVTIARDGQEAYDLVKADMEREKRFDVIFMDVQMPNLDGLQSTRLIRKMGYLAPIVALTAFSEDSNVKACIDSGMDEFLSKPIRRPALKHVLKKFATILEEPENTGATK